MRVAVVGGTGMLGALVVETLVGRGHEAHVLSRHAPTRMRTSTYRRVDLASGEGLPEALSGVEAVIDASNVARPGRRARSVLVDGTGRLLRAEAEVGVVHHVLISIIGIERVPFSYYRVKLEQERALAESRVPVSVVRSTQFHQLLDRVFESAARFGVLPAGQIALQPVDAHEVAEVLVSALEQGPWRERREVAGPEVLPLSALARSWSAATRRRRLPVPAPLVGKVGRALRDGALTDPEAQRGALTFARWLSRRNIEEPTADVKAGGTGR